MLHTTLEAIKAILSTDISVSQEERAAHLRMLKNGVNKPEEPSPDRIVRRADAAARLGVCVKTLDVWKRRGALKPVTIPGSSRATGYRESDLTALIAGKLPATV